MKNLKLILTVLLIGATVGACSFLDFQDWYTIESLNVTPTLINKKPRVFPGGNVDCMQLDLPGDVVMTTGRNDYNPSTNEFTDGWPHGLYVNVDEGKSVSFQITNEFDLMGDGKCYKVGAVIVKGGNASNVYYYTDIGGATMDKGLVAPNNASGTPAGLSNLTFCFVECVEDIYIAVKVLLFKTYTDPETGELVTNPETGLVVKDTYWGQSSGGLDLFTTSYWCDNLGVNKYNNGDEYELISFWPASNSGELVGFVKVEEVDNNIKLIVEASDDFLLRRAYIYVGSKEGLLNTVLENTQCPDYENSWTAKEVLNDKFARKSIEFIIPKPY